MRTRFFGSTAVLFLILAGIAAVLPGVADDTGSRLSDLETRVAALETHVAEPVEPASDSSSSQQSSSSSSNSSTNAYTANYSGNGDREIEVELDNSGTYQVTVTSTSALTAELLDATSDAVPGFAIEMERAGTVTTSGSLEPGAYMLRVSATSTWNVSIVLISG